MLAFWGFVVLHNITGKGPFDNLLQHLSDPWHNTITIKQINRKKQDRKNREQSLAVKCTCPVGHVICLKT
ncbi:hypothetical protein CIPAW_07G033400 [Carya illinoinensis]|uniref:Uncharacterized protein n=1 Tax=Carya illinoinensis TaxID=32201 RepID=A0A8T1PZC7_CARIL|nr:hypothetical protein CIPAW_07G033400 [Carya illinoinensis]